MTCSIGRPTALVAVLAVASAPGAALAHAFLDHTMPGVGATVSGAPNTLELDFTEGVAVAFSGVTVTTAAGAAVATSKPRADTGNPAVLTVRLARPLAPGSYVVHWHVVATDTHSTSGTYRFTVAP